VGNQQTPMTSPASAAFKQEFLSRKKILQEDTNVTTLTISFTSSPSPNYKGSLTQVFKSFESFKKIDTENEAAKQAINWLSKNMGLKWSDFK
jgi:hypothetical protein